MIIIFHLINACQYLDGIIRHWPWPTSHSHNHLGFLFLDDYSSTGRRNSKLARFFTSTTPLFELFMSLTSFSRFTGSYLGFSFVEDHSLTIQEILFKNHFNKNFDRIIHQWHWLIFHHHRQSSWIFICGWLLLGLFESDRVHVLKWINVTDNNLGSWI